MQKSKFTQEVKDNWLTALKSGNYTQGYGRLEEINLGQGNKTHCCIGVLGDIHPELSNLDIEGDKSPYVFLENTVGKRAKNTLWMVNDNSHPYSPDRSEDYKNDYSNVIPLIEALEIQE